MYHEEKIKTMPEEKTIPTGCFGVKCMRKGCTELASHKVGEENIWDEEDETEKQLYSAQLETNQKTTYLCENHFNSLMDREEYYFKDDHRFLPDDPRLEKLKHTN